MAGFAFSPLAAMRAFVLCAVLMAAVIPALAQPPSVTVNWATFRGSGCSWDNTDYVLSPDYKVITFLFGGMIARTDGSLSDKRKNCIMSLSLNYPDGWSFSLAQVIGRGYAKLEGGVKGTYQTSAFFSGQQGTAIVKRVLTGPLEETYEYTDVFGLIIWSQCNNMPNLNINVEVRVDNPNLNNGLMTVDSIDKKFELVFAFVWKMC